ncbi:hypothetical protein E2F48_11405 [Arthrobacter crusticola]|uniref:Integral membrane protein n=1 Tax=Arthrobacter crusticola TaxID=2547960 RepID=A0A4R5TXA8_9MICC|nr:hypothetical protein [Arthrobacter crusticola]TDK25824.1 hypothetical protein E2F48_11405 [Arthrobacter crusticola]
MRTLASAIFALAALALTGAALSAAWTESRLVDQQGFVDLAGPLAKDTEFQQALTGALAGEVSRGAGLPGPLQNLVRPAIENAASSVTRMSGYPRAWEETLRISHRLTLSRAPSDPGAQNPAVVSLDLKPLAGLLSQQVGTGLGINVPVPQNTTVEVGRLERGGVVSLVSRIAQLWPALAWGAGTCAVLALALARKRSTALALLGAGGAGLGVLGWLGAGLIPDAAAGTAGSSAVARIFVRGFAGRVSADFAEASLPVIAGGAVVMAVGVVLRFTFERRSMR